MVKPTFKEFDRNNSNAIERNELSSLLHRLGYNTNEYELEDAFKSLDENNSGRIEYREFRRWFLNGQKSFTQVQVRSYGVNSE